MRLRFRHKVSRRRTVVSLVVSTATVAAVVASVASAAPRPPVLRAGNPSGIVFARGAGHGNGHGPGGGGGSSPNLVYHKGPVMQSISVTPIFWGNWGSSTSLKSWMDTFYKGVGGSSYLLNTTTEYADNSGNVLSSSSPYSYFGYASDPNGWTSKKAPTTTDVLNVVTQTIGAASLTPDGYYPVYSDQPRGHNYYCAWHSWGQVNGVEVQFAFFFNLHNDPGCTPQTIYQNLSQSTDAVALGNVSGHELSETLTDPNGNAWYDSQGEENADKCAWTFSGNYLSLGGTSWEIQGNWSNAVYTAGGSTSYLGSGSGCIDGS